MIDFETERRPGRPGEWTALAQAIRASADPIESYWLELKSSIDWDTGQGVGNLARAILGMANRDPARAAAFLGGSGVVIVGLDDRNDKVHPVAVLDPADLDNKLTPYVGGSDGPRWQPHWVRLAGESVLIVEVDPPCDGDPGYTLRKSYGDHKLSQTFVREQGKTIPASQAEVERLARRMSAPSSKQTLDVIVGYSLDERLAKVRMDAVTAEQFLDGERRRLIGYLDQRDAAARLQSSTADQESARYGNFFASAFAESGIGLGLNSRPEDRSSVVYRAEVEKYIQEARESLAGAFYAIARRVVPVPRFWLSNKSERNFKAVPLTLRVEGEVEAEDLDDGSVIALRRLLPKPPRPYGPYTAATALGSLFQQGGILTQYPAFAPARPGRRAIHSGDGGISVDLDQIDLRPGETEVPIESNLVVLVPAKRSEPVVVQWRATASNVDAVASGEFELPFEGSTLDLVAVGLEADDD